MRVSGKGLVPVRVGKIESNLFPLLSVSLSLSPQADLKNQLGDAGYVVFGVVLFVWELLPTSLVVYFFRVRSPTKDLVSQPLDICRRHPLALSTRHKL